MQNNSINILVRAPPFQVPTGISFIFVQKKVPIADLPTIETTTY